VVVASCGQEGCAFSEPLGYVQAEHACVEGKCALEVGNFQVHVADVDSGVGCVL
jgi:hypothetical protein